MTRKIALIGCAVLAMFALVVGVTSLFRGIACAGYIGKGASFNSQISYGGIYFDYLRYENPEAYPGNYRWDYHLFQPFRYPRVAIAEANLFFQRDLRTRFGPLYGFELLRSTSETDFSEIGGGIARGHRQAIVLPLWPFILFGIWPTRVFWRSRRVKYRLRHGLCLKCGYNLTGNTSGRCSECGQEITTSSTGVVFYTQQSWCELFITSLFVIK